MIDLDYTLKVRVPVVILTVIVTYGVTFWLATPTRKGIGFSPEQPIAFSHKLHAGINQIDCRYCHQGADKSRHATIPSVDTCMNCHSVVKTANRSSDDGYLYSADRVLGLGQRFDTVLDGIVRATADSDFAGLNQSVVRAIATPAQLAEALNKVLESDELRASFIGTFAKAKEWDDREIKTLLFDYKDADKAKKLARFMMDELFPVDTYKSSELTKLRAYFNDGKPIPWKRIYRVPEYVYFNHSVHVNKGIDCTSCHGDVARMDKVVSMKPYDMGRCLDCHRGTYHADMEGEQVGPENCSACHR